MPEKIGLIYVGGGFYTGVPARDLTHEEVEQFGGVKELTRDGYYAVPGKPISKESTAKEGK